MLVFGLKSLLIMPQAFLDAPKWDAEQIAPQMNQGGEKVGYPRPGSGGFLGKIDFRLPCLWFKSGVKLGENLGF